MDKKQILACYKKAVELFNIKMGTAYTVDNPKLFIVDHNNSTIVFDEIAYLTGCSIHPYTKDQFFENVAAQAFVGSKGDAVAVNSYFIGNEEFLIFVLAHELGHVFCLHRELSGNFFAERYSQNDSDFESLNTGYMIWKEFVANYIAMTVSNQKRVQMCDISESAHRFVKNIDIGNTDTYDQISTYLVLLLYSTAARKDWTFLREKMTDEKLPYVGLTEVIFRHMAEKEYWLIDDEFLQAIRHNYVEDTVIALLAA